MKLIISNRSSVPIYEQIKNQIKDAILNGELKEDSPLPSIRQLAKDLKISVITTTRAYNDLESEGFVVNIQGKGCFVLPRNLDLVKENALREIEHSFEKAIEYAQRHSMTYNELLDIFNNLYKEYDDENRN
jgi:GntR family transcriptional regulator